MLKIADIVDDSIVDGPGIRLTIFTQGCPHSCKNCHNQELMSFEGGNAVTSDEIIARISANPLLSGVTFSGGEPLCQAGALIEIAKRTHDKGLNVWMYTGYKFEDVLEGKVEDGAGGLDAIELIKNSDIVIDGKFVESLSSLDLKWKGSSNQRVIDVKKSLESNGVIEWE